MLERLKQNLLNYMYLYLILFSIAFIVLNVVLVFQFNFLSISVGISVIVMLVGQMLLMTPFSVTYVFYLFSCFSITAISVLYWIARHFPFDTNSLFLFIFVIALLTVLPLTVHILTRRRIATFSLTPIFSVFLFAIVFTFGVTPTFEQSTQDAFFYVAIFLFIVNSIFGLNSSFRALMLSKNLGISDRNRYIRRIKSELLAKCDSQILKQDVDLLVFYLDSSLESFVEGDFERSYIDAYKITYDLNGKAFEALYKLPEDKERQNHFSEIRHRLSHARLGKSKSKKATEEGKEDYQILKDTKKNLYKENLNLLKIAKAEFIDEILKKDKIVSDVTEGVKT